MHEAHNHENNECKFKCNLEDKDGNCTIVDGWCTFKQATCLFSDTCAYCKRKGSCEVGTEDDK